MSEEDGKEIAGKGGPADHREGTLETLELLTEWRIQDVYPGSRILIFTHPGSRIQKQQKIVSKLSKIWVWDPGSGIGFFRS
jgi:hypothetical protein